LDTILDSIKKSWIQIWTEGTDRAAAWLKFLGRPFKGLNSDLYKVPFEGIESDFLKSKALTSLTKAGDDQQNLYDFSVNPDRIQQGDLGVIVLGSDELDEKTPLELFKEKGMTTVVLLAGPQDKNFDSDLTIHIPVDTQFDPLKVRQHIALKMALNAHSTGVMALDGRVVGNTMTNVNPGNLKLIGRATFLIQSHVNDYSRDISYADANAFLYEAIDYVQKNNKVNLVSEVPLSIVKILSDVSWEQAEKLLEQNGLEGYLSTFTKK
jgi:N-acetylmuramic acid 6-phosphate etherase